MTIAVTGATGFLGWHMRCRAFARGVPCVPIPRDAMADSGALADLLRDVDAVVHCAGVNRGSDCDVTEGNIALAQRLADAVRRLDRPVRIVYANSVHARGDSVYGTAKRKAAELVAGAAPDRFSDVLLPHLFGEHGRPYYNSFVATFCQEMASGRRPADVRDRELRLLHAQDAAESLVGQAHATGTRVVEPVGESVTVGGVLRLLTEFESCYQSGEIPDLTDRFRIRLFNTYRSHLFPNRYPITLSPKIDARGSLVECVRAAGTGGQAFFSSTVPGAVRGDHVHLRKFERFVVVDGRAEIALRRLFTDRVIRLQISGDQPAIVDIPTMWAHWLTNSGDRRLTTFFWTNELFRAGDADTFPCPVERAEGGAT